MPQSESSQLYFSVRTFAFKCKILAVIFAGVLTATCGPSRVSISTGAQDGAAGKDFNPHHGLQSKNAAEHVFDGYWWNSIESDEQYGYVLGHLDCYLDDVKGIAKGRVTFDDIQRAVSGFYKKHQDNLSTAVSDVLETVYTSQPGDAFGTNKGEEVWKAPHSFFDGLWWKQVELKVQVGYLEGYISCYCNELKNPRGHFSKSVSEYQERISKYYERPPFPEDEPVARVLFRFRDRTAMPPKRSRF